MKSAASRSSSSPPGSSPALSLLPPSRRPAFRQPVQPAYFAPAAPLRPAPVQGAYGYRFELSAAAPCPPSPYGY